jgi:hypothetical protein
VNGNHRLRPKLPSKDDVFVIPWHQDAAFFHPSADPRPSASDWSEQPPIITVGRPSSHGRTPLGVVNRCCAHHR